MVFLALVVLALSIANYAWQTNVVLPETLQMVSIGAQALLLLLALVAAALYRGRKSRPNYEGGFYRIWTIRFAVIAVSILASFSVLVVLLLYYLGVITGL
jgi:uncharacterized membrane protein